MASANTSATTHRGDPARTRRATYQDVLDAPAHRVAEIVDGTLYTQPRPPRRTRWPARGWASTSEDPSTGVAAARAVGGSSTSRSCTSARTFWSPTSRAGAGGGWRSCPDTAYFTLAPDWVCEVLSASTRRLDLQGKRPVYAREGVGHLWLVDPADRTLEAFVLREGQWVLNASAQGNDPISVRPFDAITFDLGDLWP